MAAAHLQGPATVTLVKRVPHFACTSKMEFASESDALRHVRKTRLKLRAYQCPHCRMWHTTSKEKRA